MKFSDITTSVKQGIANALSTPTDRLVSELVEIEIAKRAELLRRGYEEWKRVEAEAAGIKPGGQRVDENRHGGSPRHVRSSESSQTC